MARITVENCLKVVENRFDLVLFAAQRVRQIIRGDKITIENTEEKKPVVALREIAVQSISSGALKEELIKSFRVFTPEEDFKEDIDELPEEELYNPSVEVAQIEDNEASNIEDHSLSSDETEVESVESCTLND